MQWSKIKKQFEESLADKLRANLSIHIAVYRKPKNSSRAVIYFKKEKIVEVSIPSCEDESFNFSDDVKNFGEAIGDIINMSIDNALSSNDPIIKGLAFLDKRTGKRRLLKTQGEALHPFSRKLFELRLKSEEIRSS